MNTKRTGRHGLTANQLEYAHLFSQLPAHTQRALVEIMEAATTDAVKERMLKCLSERGAALYVVRPTENLP